MLLIRVTLIESVINQAQNQQMIERLTNRFEEFVDLLNTGIDVVPIHGGTR